MSAHKVVAIRRLRRDKRPTITDTWEVSIDGIKMEGFLYLQRHGNPGSGYQTTYAFRFTNKLLVKHPDYKSIRLQLINQIRYRYANQSKALLWEELKEPSNEIQNS